MTTKTLAIKKHRLFINAVEGGDTMVWLGLAGTSDWVLLSNGADRADAVAVAVEQLERLAKRLAKELA